MSLGNRVLKLRKHYIYSLFFLGFVILTTLILLFTLPDSIITPPLEFAVGGILSIISPKILGVLPPGSFPTYPLPKECTDFLVGTFVVLYLALGTFSRRQRWVSITAFVPMNFLLNLIRVILTIFALDTNYELYSLLHPVLYAVYFIAAIYFLWYLIRSQHIHFSSSLTFFFIPPVVISTPLMPPRSNKIIAKRIFLAYLLTSASGIGIILLFPNPGLSPACTDPFIESTSLDLDGNAALDAFCAGNGTDGLSWDTAYVIENISIHRSGMCINFQNLNKFLILRNCTLQSHQNSCINYAMNSRIGIMLRNCTKIKIIDCHLIGFYTGIYLTNVSQLVVSGNHIFNATGLCSSHTEVAEGYGITCESSQLNNISNNNISLVVPGNYGPYYCGYPGITRSSISLKNASNNTVIGNLANSILVDVSANNTIDKNTAYIINVQDSIQNCLSNNLGNLMLSGGCKNLLNGTNGTFFQLQYTTNNTLQNNSIEFLYLFQAHNNTLINNTANELELAWASNNSLYYNDLPISIIGSSSNNFIDTTNSVSGKPLYYYENRIGLDIENQTIIGQIIFLNCNNSQIKNNVISNNSAGIVLIHSGNNSLFNNSICNNPSNGLFLFDSSNNTLLNQTSCNNSGFGIFLHSSHNNTISNSNSSNNGFGGNEDYGFVTPFNGSDGVSLLYSNDNFLANITSVNNAGCGLTLYDSLNIMVINNSINGNAADVCISESNNITLVENEIWGNGIEMRDSHNLSIDITNRVNGKSIRYFEGQTSGELSNTAPVGQVILNDCQNFQVSNLNISLVSYAISLEYCQNITLVNVTVSLNEVGFVSTHSQDISILRSTFAINQRYGIELKSSDNVNLSCNVVVNNDGSGIDIIQSDNAWISGNNISNNYQNGIFVEYSYYNVIFNNTLSNNVQQGLFLSDSHNFTIEDNIIMQNGESGIDIRWSDYNLIVGNTIIMNNDEGTVTSTVPILYQPHPAPENAHCGILSYLSDYNIFMGNIITYNGEGFHLCESDFNIIEDNTVMYNTNSGICLEFSSNNQILRNHLRQNGGVCILLLDGCENNDICDNECDDVPNLVIYIIIAIMGLGTCVVIIFRHWYRKHRLSGASRELANKMERKQDDGLGKT